MIKDILLYFALLLWFVVPAAAQLTMIAPVLEAQPGQTVEMDIKVMNFDSVLSMQFSLNWDSTVLKFVDIKSFGVIPNLNKSSFSNSKPGVLRALWVTSGSEGISVSDSTSIFTLVFSAIGQPDSSTSIAFSNEPTIIEFIGQVNGNNQNLDFRMLDGSLTLMSTTAVYSLSEPTVTLFQNEPNPFTEYTTIRFSMPRHDHVMLEVYDLKGQLIYMYDDNYSFGEQRLKLFRPIFPAAGTYLYRLKSTDFELTKKMIVK